ncbi:MAG: LLM class F420-dependent oxidoreductase [Alphaproteobacteria bacterium]
MHIGIAIFPTDYSIQPMELAREVEARGLDSLWFPEHSHIPTSRVSPWPGGGELPKHYYDTYDPFMALTAAAAVTSKIKLATGICLVVQRDPIHLAKEVSTIDQLSGGRFLFGIGGGWNAEEMADHGTAFETRFKLMRERIEAMKAIWTSSKAEYHGEFVDFDEMMQWPKPVQKPHPPVILGGGYPQGARRAIRYGDGWMPLDGRDNDWNEVLPGFRQMLAESGREPDSIELSVFGMAPKADRAKMLRDAGIARGVIALPSADRDTVLPLLDQAAELIRAVA